MIVCSKAAQIEASNMRYDISIKQRLIQYLKYTVASAKLSKHVVTLIDFILIATGFTLSFAVLRNQITAKL